MSPPARPAPPAPLPTAPEKDDFDQVHESLTPDMTKPLVTEEEWQGIDFGPIDPKKSDLEFGAEGDKK